MHGSNPTQKLSYCCWDILHKGRMWTKLYLSGPVACLVDEMLIRVHMVHACHINDWMLNVLSLWLEVFDRCFLSLFGPNSPKGFLVLKTNLQFCGVNYHIIILWLWFELHNESTLEKLEETNCRFDGKCTSMVMVARRWVASRKGLNFKFTKPWVIRFS